MYRQLSIFDSVPDRRLRIEPKTVVRRSDPETSRQAAEAINFRETHFKAILEALTVPMGKDGISKITGLSGVQVARRISELIRLGKVRPTGKTTSSLSGRQEREIEKIT